MILLPDDFLPIFLTSEQEILASATQTLLSLAPSHGYREAHFTHFWAKSLAGAERTAGALDRLITDIEGLHQLNMEWPSSVRTTIVPLFSSGPGAAQGQIQLQNLDAVTRTYQSGLLGFYSNGAQGRRFAVPSARSRPLAISTPALGVNSAGNDTIELLSFDYQGGAPARLYLMFHHCTPNVTGIRLSFEGPGLSDLSEVVYPQEATSGEQSMLPLIAVIMPGFRYRVTLRRTQAGAATHHALILGFTCP